MDIKIYVPANLDFGLVAQEFPFNELPTKNRSAEFLYVFCGILADSKAKQGEGNQKGNGYVRLCAKYLRNIHLESHLFIKLLIDSDIIDGDGIYIEGERCMGYKFTPKYEGQFYKEIEIQDFRLKKAIKKQKAHLKKVCKENIKSCNHIIKWYMNHHLQIDGAAARQWINNYYETKLEEIDSKEFKKKKKEAKTKDLIAVCNNMFRFVDKIEGNSYDETEFSICEAGNRLHGMFTYNKSELREFVTYNGLPLVSVDIKNSQPYLSTLLFSKEFWQSKKVKSRKLQLVDIAPDIYKEMREDGTINRTITMMESSTSLMQQDVSTARYMNLAINGEIYEYLMREMAKKLSTEFLEKFANRIQDRKAIKREVLRVMYCENEVTNDFFYETCRVFQSLFPHVAKTFKIVKTHHYQRLACILQRIESHLVLQVITKRIAKECPKIPLFTIHDSIVTTVGNEHKVKEITEQVLSELVGLPPQLSFEYWKPENAYQTEPNNNYICQNQLEYEDIEIS